MHVHDALPSRRTSGSGKRHRVTRAKLHCGRLEADQVVGTEVLFQPFLCVAQKLDSSMRLYWCAKRYLAQDSIEQSVALVIGASQSTFNCFRVSC